MFYSRQYVYILVLLLSVMSSFTYARQSLDVQPGLDMFDSKKYAEAQDYFYKLSSDHPNDAEVAYYLGRSYLQSRNLKDAVQFLEKAVTLECKKVEYQYLLGIAYASYIMELSMFKKMDVAKKMKQAWLTATTLDASHKEARIALIGFYVNAPKIAGGSNKKALENLRVLKQQYPDEVFSIEGRIAEKNKQPDRAEQLFRQAVETNRHPRTIFSLANYLSRRNKTDEAISLFTEFLAMDLSWNDPTKAFTHFLLGNIYAECRKYPEAKKEYQLALNENHDKFLAKLIREKVKELR